MTSLNKRRPSGRPTQAGDRRRRRLDRHRCRVTLAEIWRLKAEFSSGRQVGRQAAISGKLGASTN